MLVFLTMARPQKVIARCVVAQLTQQNDLGEADFITYDEKSSFQLLYVCMCFLLENWPLSQGKYFYITSFQECLQNYDQDSVRFVLSAQHWEERIQLDQYCIKELRFWRINLDYFEVRDCFHIHTPQRFVYSYAIATGCGSVITLNENNICLYRLWEPSECSKSPILGENLPPLIFLSNHSPQFRRAPSSIGCRIVSRLLKSSKCEG